MRLQKKRANTCDGGAQTIKKNGFITVERELGKICGRRGA